MEYFPEKLIIVPGHAPFKASVSDVPEDPPLDKWWVLQDFQHGEPPYYIEHIQKGVEIFSKNPEHSVLLFSGGRTREQGGAWSEAATYAAIAGHARYWAEDQVVLTALKSHTLLETYARDSYENVKFGLCRFYQECGRYPASVTVVGWPFKAERFAMHRQALGIPAERFEYVGCRDPEDIEGALAGEAKARKLFADDPHGEYEPLAGKRLARDPFGQGDPYRSCPPIVVSGG